MVTKYTSYSNPRVWITGIVFFCLFFFICTAFAKDSLFLNQTEKWTVKTLIQFSIIALSTLALHFLFLANTISYYNKTQFTRKIFLHQIMTKNTVTIDMKSSLEDAQDLFLRHEIHHLPVSSPDHKLVGIITRQDINNFITKERKSGKFTSLTSALSRVTVQEIMIKQILAMDPHDSLHKALRIFSKYSYGCIPIVNEHDQIIGIITKTDIIKLLSSELLK